MEYNVLTLPPNTLLHSVQVYWMTTAETLNYVKEQLINTSVLNDETITDINNTIQAGYSCANLYGKLIIERSCTHNNDDIYNVTHTYTTGENIFYILLSRLLDNQDIKNCLREKVTDEVNNGTRYFDTFLRKIGVDY